MTAKPKDHMFSADRPIESADKDLLGRAPFARQLASAVSGWRGNDSLVLALHGTWGIGKSSIKNMVLEALRNENAQPHVVEYNPWQWTGHDQLADGFFSEIGRALRRGPDSKEARKREHAWRLYAARLGVPIALTDATRRLAAWALALGGIAGLVSPAAVAYLPRAAASAPFIIASAIMLSLAGLLSFTHGLFDRLAAAASSRAAMLEQTTLSEQKSQLRSLLTTLDRPVLVVVDDIDRLRPGEVRLLFQLVKANADFPNLTYLLLFQRDIVEKSIMDGGTQEEGRDFLEKIVQVGFDVPPVEVGRMHQALFAGLNQILDDEVVARRFDGTYWQSVFSEMRSFFGNLRDVARFLGSFAFHVSLFRKDRSFEVNPVDLIALEAMRLFEPAVYSRLRTSKALLTSAGSAFGSRRDTKGDQAALQLILESASPSRRDAVRGLLGVLFPSVANTSYGDGSSDTWFRCSRICHEKLFDRYFLLALPEGDVSQADLDYLLENSASRETVSERLVQYAREGRIEAMLERLESYKQSLPRECILPFLTAIMDVGDQLPERPPGMFVLGADMHASRFIHWSLKSVADQVERATILRQACIHTVGVFLPLREVVQQESKENAAQTPEAYFLSDEEVRACKDALLTRIRQRARHDLATVTFLPFILFRWKEWGKPGEVSTWVTELITQGNGVITLLRRFLTKVTSTPMVGGIVTVRHRLSLKALGEFVNITSITDALNQLEPATLDDSDRVAVDAFRKALRREAAGKSEDSFDLDDD